MTPAPQGKPRSREFVFARLRYDSGDWDYNPKVAANILNSVVEYTNIPVYPEEIVITATRTPEKRLDSPINVEWVSDKEVMRAPGGAMMSALANVKGIDFASSGLKSTIVDSSIQVMPRTAAQTSEKSAIFGSA